jgi:hypothetical protein
MKKSPWPLLLLAAVSCAGQADQPPPGLAGVWGGDALVRFEGRKVFVHEEGKLDIYAARYGPGKVELSSMGQTMAWEIDLRGDGLSLRSPDGKLQLRFRRLKEVPDELQVRARPLQAAQPLPAERVEAIAKELAQRKKTDQAVRLDPARQKDQPKVDSDNYAYLVQLIDEVGWIDATRFGGESTGAAFLIAQHSGDLALLLAIRPLIEVDARAGRIDKSYLASIHDRVLAMQAEPQRYGTQLGRNDQGEMLVLPLEDRQKVDAFRKELGLPPLADYLEQLRRRHGWRIRFAEE